MKNVNQQSGFTLIELVVVIVILGILAATAAPRFIDLQADAQTSTLNAVRGAMQSASNLVYSKALIDGNNVGTATTDVNNVTIDTVNGYPASSGALTTTSGPVFSWNSILDNEGFIIGQVTFGTDTYIVAYPDGGDLPGQNGESFPLDLDSPQSAESDCFAFYLQSTALNVAPTTGVAVCL